MQRKMRIGAGVRRAFVVLSLGAAVVSLASMTVAQPAEPPNGPRRTDPSWHALVHARVVSEPGTVLEDATIVIRDGVIRSVEAKGAAPAGARVWDCTGLSVYPGLIDPFVPVDAPRPDADAPGTHWNPQVMAQRSALDGDGLSADARKKLRGQGYTVANVAPRGGIFAGMAAVQSLAEQGDASEAPARVLKARSFHVVALETPRGAQRSYPSSRMGAIALVRQTLADAPWFAKAQAAYKADPARSARPEPNDALAALNEQIPLLFDVNNELDALRAVKIAKEFGRAAVIVGGGTEFRRIDAVTGLGMPLIEPLAYPDRPKVETQAEREAVELRDLMTWEAAPTNVKRLDAAGAKVSITSSKLARGQEFFANLRLAIKGGLSEERALAMLTTNPAEVLGLGERIGRVKPGFDANLVVVKGSLFDEKRQVRDVWVDGKRHEVTPAPKVDLEGDWDMSISVDPAAPIAGTLRVVEKNRMTFTRPANEQDAAREKVAKEKAQAGKPEGEKAAGGADQTAAAAGGEGAKKKPETKRFRPKSSGVAENRVNLVLEGAAVGLDSGLVAFSAIVEETMIGTGTLPDGKAFTWTATRKPAPPKEPGKEGEADRPARGGGGDEMAGGGFGGEEGAERAQQEDKDRFTNVPEKYGLPFGPYAFDQQPASRNLVVRSAALWTSGTQGTIKGGVLGVAGGKVVYVGKDVNEAKAKVASAAKIKAADVETLDLPNAQVSAGLIDCHSHTGISGGVNEGTQAVTAEVRIFDVIDPDAIGFYRELAGGLTACNQLHGSANPIGGQNSVVKLRWGAATPDDMRIEGAIAGIKFALGENVKQSNWEGTERTRYPQTRMGVETIIRDRFTTAREYAAQWKAWEAKSDGEKAKGVPPRRDLELEALAEILAGQRLVHCHSYRQDEILMLCRVAQDYGFRIGTFQHVLEGYKVAEAIRDHAIGGSSFSDWWAYKFEVFDAIPYDGAIMHSQGVVVSFNSDSDELARRMNVEAAKAVKYGNVPPEEAIQFVTLNPAKQLKVDHLIGSLEVGKDADFVIWSGDPLSSMSRCESTFIDGREYFSRTRDAQMRDQIKAERQRLITKVMASPRPGRGGAGEGEGRGAGMGRPGGPGAPGAPTDPAPTFEFLTSRGRFLAPVALGEEIERWRDAAYHEALYKQYQWLVSNGIDPMQWHQGDCGCGMDELFR